MTLNDPSVLNAFGFKLRQDMSWALDQVEASGARCLMITGAGRAFCSGANLNDPDRPPRDRAAEARGEVKSDLESWYNPTFIRLRDLAMPIVTAINGIAAGAGMSLALMGDIRIAASSASFLQAFARIGLVPDCGSSYVLPRMIGMARAMELVAAGGTLAGGNGVGLGHDQSRGGRSGFAGCGDGDGATAGGRSGIAGADPQTVLGFSLENSYEQQLDLEAKLQMQAGLTEDYTEGVTAFREKRRTRFTGR